MPTLTDPMTAVTVDSIYPGDSVLVDAADGARRLTVRSTADGLVHFADESGAEHADLISVWNRRLARGTYELLLEG